jgi:hypothetical protein
MQRTCRVEAGDSYRAEPDVNAKRSSVRDWRVTGLLSKGRAFGDDDWAECAAKRLGLESSLRDRGRPAKMNPESKGQR